jgi:hypothetical protein
MVCKLYSCETCRAGFKGRRQERSPRNLHKTEVNQQILLRNSLSYKLLKVKIYFSCYKKQEQQQQRIFNITITILDIIDPLILY